LRGLSSETIRSESSRIERSTLIREIITAVSPAESGFTLQPGHAGEEA
jgi:hypothetical protein